MDSKLKCVFDMPVQEQLQVRKPLKRLFDWHDNFLTRIIWIYLKKKTYPLQLHSRVRKMFQHQQEWVHFVIRMTKFIYTILQTMETCRDKPVDDQRKVKDVLAQYQNENQKLKVF